MAPARAIEEGSRQDSERGDAVEQNREFEPEDGHVFLSVAGAAGSQNTSITWAPPLPRQMCAKSSKEMA